MKLNNKQFTNRILSIFLTSVLLLGLLLVTAFAEDPFYNVTVSLSSDHGIVDAVPSSAAEGETVWLNAVAEEGWFVDTLTAMQGDKKITIHADGTFLMPAGDVTVTATFQEEGGGRTAYTVAVDEGIANGSVIADTTSATVGTVVTLTVTPDTGYILDTLQFNDTAILADANGAYTFAMPWDSVTITATFIACSHIWEDGSCEVCGTAHMSHDFDESGKCICGEQAEAKVIQGSDSTYYSSFAGAWSAWTDGTTLRLLADATPTGFLSVTGSRSLDLNGWKLNITSSSGLNIQKNATLTIQDSGNTGAVVFSSIDDYLTVMKGKLIVTGGTFSTGGNVDQLLIYCYAGTLDLSGATIPPTGWSVKAINEDLSASNIILPSSYLLMDATTNGRQITTLSTDQTGYIIKPIYTVSFDTNGGEAIAPINVTYGEKYGKLPSSAIKGLSGGNSNWYLVDENGKLTDTKITSSTKVSFLYDHTLQVVRKVLAPNVTLTLTVPGGLSDKETIYLPENSTRVLKAVVGNGNEDVLNYTYAWYKDGTLLDGENGSVLTLAGNVSDSGIYKVVVTATIQDDTGITVTESSASTTKEQKVTIRHAANTLYYDANGGEGGPSSNYTGSDKITVQTRVPTRTDYLFTGWNTAADGSGESYKGGDSYTFADDNGNGGCKVMLYAQWLKVYDVYVGGTQITEANQDDVFGDGKVSYDPQTNLLTLNAYTYEGDGFLYGSHENTNNGVTELYSAAIYSADSITIALQGNTFIKNTFSDSEKAQYGDGIAAQGDLTFIGDGSINVIGAYAVYADKTVTVDGILLDIDAVDDGIVADTVVVQNNANVILQAERYGIYACKNVTITDSCVTVDVDGDGIYCYDGSVVINSTKTNVSALGPWLEGTKVTIQVDGDYGIFAYKGLTVEGQLTISSPDNGSVGELPEQDYTYGTVIVDGAAAKEIVIEPLGYKVTITGLSYGMEALLPAGQSLNSTYCERYGVEDFSEILDTRKEGFTFGGWYIDESCTDGNEFQFSDAVYSNVTIYPKWVSVGNGDDADDNGNKPTDGTSPDTGDNSNMFLWIALLLISGGAVILLTVVDRKKKAVTR